MSGVGSISGIMVISVEWIFFLHDLGMEKCYLNLAMTEEVNVFYTFNNRQVL